MQCEYAILLLAVVILPWFEGNTSCPVVLIISCSFIPILLKYYIVICTRCQQTSTNLDVIGEHRCVHGNVTL